MKRALKGATEIFPTRLCKGKLPSRVCLAYHIGRCPGPCENKISKKEYHETIKELIDFLSGKSQKVEQKLLSKMKKLSANLEFEEAAKVRDRLMSVKAIIKKQRVVFNKPLDLDVFGVHCRGNKACIVLVMVREGRILGSEHYIMHIQRNSTNSEIIRAFLLQYYKNAFYVPREIVVPEVEEKEIIEKWLNSSILLPKRGEKFELIKFATQNAEVWLETEEKEHIPEAIKELQEKLNLKVLPRRIEAFDVSNIGGKYAVGSCVLFVDAKAQKNGYKRFKIKTVHKIDDVGMMKEILARRIKYEELPDLVLIDGGIGQVRAAKRCLPNEIPVFGLAKRTEELYTPENKIISLPRDSVALRLLQRIRNEAHRFAISYHKKLRDHPTSLLLEIPGIGEKRRQILLQHFKSFEKLRQASIEELEQIPGIGKTYAQEVYEFLSLI
jgi:excinuclease ABC subunit C